MRVLLADPKQQTVVRTICAAGLGLMHDPSFDSRGLLKWALDDPKQPSDVRAAAALSLGLLHGAPGDPAYVSVRRTLDAAAWGEGEPSGCAFVALGLSGDPRELRTLLTRIESGGDGTGAACAAIGIGKLAGTHPAIIDSRVVEILITASWALDPVVCRGAVSALGQIGRGVDLDCADRLKLLRTLSDQTDSKDEATAALALVSLGRTAAAAPHAARRVLVREKLKTVIEKDQPVRRAFAALALALLSRGPHLTPLERSEIREALRAGFAKQRGEAAYAVALGLVGQSEAVPELTALLRSRKTREPVRSACTIGLALIGDPRGREPVRDALTQTGNSANLRIQAALAAGILGDRAAVRILLTAPRNERARNRTVRLRALGKLGDGRALDPLLAIVGDKGSAGPTRALAAIAVADLFDRTSRLPLTDLTRDLAYGLKLSTLDRIFSVF